MHDVQNGPELTFKAMIMRQRFGCEVPWYVLLLVPLEPIPLTKAEMVFGLEVAARIAAEKR